MKDPATKRAEYFKTQAENVKRVRENIRKDQALKDWRRAKEIEHMDKAWYSMRSTTEETHENGTSE